MQARLNQAFQWQAGGEDNVSLRFFPSTSTSRIMLRVTNPFFSPFFNVAQGINNLFLW
jgi:hypothetical protein